MQFPVAPKAKQKSIPSRVYMYSNSPLYYPQVCKIK